MITRELHGYVSPATRRPGGGPWLLLGAFLLAGITYAVLRQPTKDDSALPSAQQVVVTDASESEAKTEARVSVDFRLHAEHLLANVQKASEKVWKAQDLVRKTAPSLDRNFLGQQRRRLESADANCELARRELEAALEEIEMMLTHLTKEGE